MAPKSSQRRTELFYRPTSPQLLFRENYYVWFLILLSTKTLPQLRSLYPCVVGLHHWLWLAWRDSGGGMLN